MKKEELCRKNERQVENMRRNLQTLRREWDWTIENLSERMGFHKKILADIESGKDFETEYLLILCNLYGLKLREIFETLI